ncbi:RXT3-like protein [Artemisia annua]|uniref:RXT3-like protein n=1 Tax=Artemisia annua TaxID=35608 RepID=A0A2U1NRW3_ARTAN|nr:RXT3-like protein [Artemisia annua]
METKKLFKSKDERLFSTQIGDLLKLWANPPGVTNVEIYRLIKERQCGTFRQVAFSFIGIFVVTQEIPEFFEGVEVTEEETDYVETSTATISPLVTATVEAHSFSYNDLCQEILMHTGFCRPTASPPPSAIQELRATIRVLPPQILLHCSCFTACLIFKMPVLIRLEPANYDWRKLLHVKDSYISYSEALFVWKLYVALVREQEIVVDFQMQPRYFVIILDNYLMFCYAGTLARKQALYIESLDFHKKLYALCIHYYHLHRIHGKEEAHVILAD